MLSAAARPDASSLYGAAQPPCANPFRASSSGAAGDWYTPSRVRFSKITILLMFSSLPLIRTRPTVFDTGSCRPTR